MKITDKLLKNKVSISFEMFPPKTQKGYDNVLASAKEIASLNPSFMSVTYGAGGGTSENTVSIAKEVKATGVESIAHLTCLSSTKAEVRQVLTQIKEAGIENILALRGDRTDEPNTSIKNDYSYAYELVKEIKELGDFCVGAACYPEGHTESASKEEDLIHLKEKVDCGVDFLTTQMFFDNNILYNFLYRIREKGITIPVFAGIMPVTNGKQIDRICKLSGTYLPTRFKAIVDKFGNREDAMTQAGIAYATEQIIDLLANGVNGIHVYSMNKPEIAKSIMNNISEIIKE